MGSVAFYIGSLKKGGAERVFVNLATYFLEQGCNVTMVTQYKKEMCIRDRSDSRACGAF